MIVVSSIVTAFKIKFGWLLTNRLLGRIKKIGLEMSINDVTR